MIIIHFSMQEEDIAKHANAKCQVFTEWSTC